MDSDLIITLCIIGIAIFLFVKEYFSIDTTSIIIMCLLIVSGVLSPTEGFKGFNHPATITLGAMFVISAGIFNSGVMNGFSAKLLQLGKKSYLRAVAALMVTAMVFSAFVNDTAVVAVLMPVTIYLANHMKISPSKFLIPLSFAALFGGTCTMIGTSTNLLVTGYVQEAGLEPFRIFDFFLPAIIIGIAGLLYMLLAGIRILPNRLDTKDLVERTEEYYVEIKVLPDSEDIGKKVHESLIAKNYSANILEIIRGNIVDEDIHGDTELYAYDILKIIITPKNLSQLVDDENYQVIQNLDIEDLNPKGPLNIYEVMVPFGSGLAGLSPKEMDFRRKYRAVILGMKHKRDFITHSISETKIAEGDLLLLRTTKFRMQDFIRNKMLYTVSEIKQKAKVDKRKAWLSISILVAVVLAASLGITNILISGMVGALAIVAFRILTPKEAYNAIDWKVIFMIAGVISMGVALEKTGGARMLAENIELLLGGYDPRITLSVIYLATFLSTNVLSSKATAALMAPIVINVAQEMGLSERPFIVAVMFACSLTFMTPVSYPTSAMVYTPGNYKFTDYLKVGTPLNIITWILASLLIPYFFPF